MGCGLGHGIGASLADSIFQLLAELGWCEQALASEEGRRVACTACMKHLQTVGDTWLAVEAHDGELRHGVHAGEIMRFALSRHGKAGVALPDQIILRTYSRFDGLLGADGLGVSVLFTRAELEGEEPALGVWPCVDEVRAHGNAVVFEVYNSTGENISRRTCGPAWPSVGKEMPVAAPGRGRVTQTEGIDTGARAKQPRITGKTSPGHAVHEPPPP